MFVEGEKTEPAYLTALQRRSDTRVRLNIEREPGTPLQLVTRAIERRERDRRDERRRRGRAYDEYWCVYDRDEHPSFDEAGSLAANHGIFLAVSNPCIELWFILHFQDQTAHIGNKPATRLARELLGCGKVLTEGAKDALFEHRETARARAVALDARHERNGSPDGHNPSSSLHLLASRVAP